MSVRLITGDCRQVMVHEGPFDLIVADQPYGDTALSWDRLVGGWTQVALQRLKPTGSLWVFGSMRTFMRTGTPDGFRYAQDIVWEKHNGSGFAKDRFKRVHEHAIQFYRADAPWAGVYNDVQRVPRTGPDKTGAVRRQLPHTGKIGVSTYVDDGTRIVRSVVKHPSVRGGPHKTAKPIDLLELLIRTSCPPDGLVGDFFAGSGAAAMACLSTARRYVGCDTDPKMADAWVRSGLTTSASAEKEAA